VIAYKFLAAGAIAPFTGFQWPIPGPAGAGAWVEAPEGRLTHGIHACRVTDLTFWLDAELWRVSGWNAEMARSLAEACVWHARDRALVALRAAGFDREAEALAACTVLSELHAGSKGLSSRKGLPAALAGYLAEAIDFLLTGDSSCSAYICARAAVIASGGIESEFAAERENQAALLAKWLGL